MSSYSRDERTSAMLCHFSAYLSYYFPPFAGLLVTLALWLAKRENSAFVKDQGKEALNFQISVAIYYSLIWAINLAILYMRPCGDRLMVPFLQVPLLGLPLFAIISIYAAVSVMAATLCANRGEKYDYKFIMRFIK